MTHFEVGKCYRLGEEGKTLYRIESRTEKSALISALYDDGSIHETMRKKIYTEECGNIKEERIYPLGKSGTSAYSVISSRYEAESTTTSQPEALQPEIANNPGFTVEPSREIERPNYTPYPDTIADERPYVYVQPCYTPTHHTAVNPITAATMRFASSLAALLFVVYKVIIPVWYMRKKDLKKASANTFMFIVGNKYHVILNEKYQLITITDRRTDKYGFTWLSISDEDHNSYNVKVNTRYDSYTEFFDLKGLDRTCYAFQGLTPRKEIYRSKRVLFEVGKSYTAVDKNDEQRKRHLTVLDRFAAVRYDFKDKIIKLKVRISGYNIKSDYVEGWIDIFHLRNDDKIENYYMTSYLIFRADNPDTVQETPAEISDITPEAYWGKIIADNQNSIINFTWDDFLRDNANMHPKLQAKFHDEICKHNFALVDACKSHDEIRQLLAGSTEPALIGIMNLTYDYFGTHGEYHPKEMDSIPHMIDSLIERIDYCREDKVYWTKVKKRQSSQQPQPQADAPKLLRLYLASDHKEYNRIRRENKARIDACDSEEGIVALMLTLDGTGILNQADYCRVSLFNADRKTDEQLAREFAAAIMKRRAKKLKASQQKTQSQPRKENPASASDSEHKLIDTKDLHFSENRKALEHNAAVITPCLFPEAAVALLMSISAKAVIQLGSYMGLFIAKQKGSKNAVVQEFVKRLFNIRDTHSNKPSNDPTTPSRFTLHIPEGVKIVQLKNRQLGFIFTE